MTNQGHENVGLDTLRWMMKELDSDCKALAGRLEEVEDRVKTLEIELAKQGVKMGIWAAIGAAVPVVAAYVLQILK